MEDLQFRLKFEKGGQKKFLISYMKYKDYTSQENLAFSLKVNKETMRNWIKEKTTLPDYIFKKICSDFKEGIKFNNLVIKRLPINWGAKKGGEVRKLQFGNVKNFFKNLRDRKEKIRLSRHKKLKKTKKIINNIVLRIIKEKINTKSLLVTYLLTDGSLLFKNKNYRLCFFTKDETLKSFTYDLLLKDSRYLPSLSQSKKTGIYLIRVSDNYLANALFKLNKYYKKIPFKNQSLKDYMKMPQPSLNFLKKINKKTREWCLRLAMSTDGYVSIPLNGSPTAGLTCYHPTLCYEWQEIFALCGIRTYVVHKKDSWCGVAGVKLSTDSIPKFWEIGGFIDGVKISKKSKRYKGMEKNALLRIAVNKINGAVA